MLPDLTALLLSDAVTSIMRSWRSRDRESLGVTLGGDELKIEGIIAADQRALIEEFLKAHGGAQSPPSDLRHLSRAARASDTAAVGRPPPPIELDPGTLAVLPKARNELFRRAHTRNNTVFRLNVGILAALSVILLAGIAAIASGLLGKTIWIGVFGGGSLLDAIGLGVLRPVTAIRSTLVATERLDFMSVRLQEELAQCDEVAQLDDRIKCSRRAWDKIQREIRTLAESSSPGS